MFRCRDCFFYEELATRRVYKTSVCQQTFNQPVTIQALFVSFLMCFLISKPASIANLISHWD